MKALLKLLRGARLIARGKYGQEVVDHYLLSSGDVIEIVYKTKVESTRSLLGEGMAPSS